MFTSLNASKSVRHNRSKRRGAAAVELAVCLPAIVLIAFGAIQATSMTFLRQACVQSAYETVKESVRRNGTQAGGNQLGQQVLATRNVTGGNISFSPANVDAAAKGTPITVTVTAPGDANTVYPFGPFSGQTITVQAHDDQGEYSLVPILLML